ncbi:HAD family hydrolase [Aerococcus sanguinicola]|uniref:HAD family hydrolase n=1 Tax=unclassified Aerococcus TaxID=2618060 RepID=UPI0008A1C8B6|nr:MULTISPECIES: HAD family phosphatase [unclassified Aerococcus]KAB0646527.1 HAD family phosphatase [Aerococcus sanguinicola]MDK6233809.1 HAD family phosphatase [Aerococcus sp. UMB10185]MDK6805881.1 HAD family phosphatase [Aerococcus sp. UMB7834]MDK6855889.1 HAD family phosphatase [Aerococcus sp. UMB7533]OFN03942.1 hypothetical protein HMPREF2626_04815 [Aerococcus sp. HMSC062A02]
MTQKTHLFFDMDGLLIDTEALYFETRQAALLAHGYPYSKEDHAAYAGRGWRYTLSRLQDLAGPSQGQEIFDQALATFREGVAAGRLQLKPGVEKLLAFAKDQGYVSYITSASTRYNVLTMTETTGIQPYFEAYVCGEDIERSKPYPDVYEEALKRAGIAREAALVFEDSESGFLSARAAGLDTVLIPDLLPASPQMRDQACLCLDQIDEVIPYLMDEEWRSL